MRMTFLQQVVQLSPGPAALSAPPLHQAVAEEVAPGVIYLSDIVNAIESSCPLNAARLPMKQPILGMKWLF
jgi:hypothetical protein